MLRNPRFVLDDVEEIKQLIRDYPWATIVASTSAGMVASHYPVLLDESDVDGITLLSHVGRPDDELLELGRGEVLVVIQGPHGYISPSWYPEDQLVPTWNHVSAHLWGTPEILDAETNFAVLNQLTNHFEQRVEHPRSLTTDEETTRHVATGTAGFRLVVTRVDARAKLSQNKAEEVQLNVIEHLRTDPAYRHDVLADAMEHHRARTTSGD